MKTGVVGLGLIGGSVLRALGGIGYDVDAAVRSAAAADGFAVARDLAGLADCDLVIVAVPPGRTAEVVTAVLGAAPCAAVADTASVKGPVIDALGAGERFVGAHPLAGSEAAGWGASDAGIVAGSVWAVCPAGASLEPVCRLSAAVERLDGRLVACTAGEHDASVARTSHVPHLAAAALAALAGDPLRAALSGTALRDMTRVARADATLWADILAANREAALEALDELEARMAGLRVALAGGDREVLARVWARATDALARVDDARWAEPVWEAGRFEEGWDGLLALGRAGRSVRRLDLRDGVLSGGGLTVRRRFDPSGPLRGTIAAPADKSLSHRAALLAAMSIDPVRVTGYLDAADTNSTLAAVEALGALVERQADGLTIRGTGLRAAAPVAGAIDVGNAGTLMRLLPGWLAGQPEGSWTLDGDESIRRRPVDRIAEPLRRMGASIEARDDRFAPFTVTGSPLTAIEYELPVASAQIKSCVLLAGLLATGETAVVEPAPSRDHTERLLLRCGVTVEREAGRIRVCPQDELELGELHVPGDPSSAAFHVAAAVLVPGSRIVIGGMAANWTRVGFLRILERMGAILVGELEEPHAPLSPDEPVTELDVAHGALAGTTVDAEEVPLAIDELPLVALLGCFAEGETTVRGAAELRVKETDRIATVVDGLRGLGSEIEATADGFVVQGTGGLRGGVMHSHGDHRLAMLGAVAGLASREGVEVEGMEAAAVSYPGFEADLAHLRS